MKTTTVAALTALLSSGALAVPMAGHNHKVAPAHGHLHLRNKRDIIWETVTEIETVVVMKTVYDDGSSPSEPTDVATTTIKTSAPTTTSSSVVVPAPSSPSETGGSAPPAYTPPTTSSAAPAPTSSTSSYVAPAPPSTTTQAPAPTTYSPEPAPAPTTSYVPEPAPQPSYSAPAPSSSQPSSGGGATFTGDATYWEPAMGACGWTNSADELVVAISQTVFDPKTPGGNPNNNPLCGKFVAIKCKDGSTVNAKVVDRCVGCASGDLDMTKTLFDKVTSNGDGRVGGMQWSWA
ncbi:Hypothetical protein D9617_26g079240 [Elsinoe fawcettii]|nr:Hypothetical protein D9617_26g079240 [Elsinoe fawcettii]